MKKANENDQEPQALSGKGAETIYRDKVTGKKLKLEDIIKQQEEQHKYEQSAPEYTWGKGLVQEREKQKQKEEEEKEAAKPLQRYEDDEDLNIMQMAASRTEDPMLRYLQNQKIEKQLRKGQKIKKQKPVLTWANRFNINPGPHWDGVNRSNGFEKKLLTQINQQGTLAERDHMANVSDM